MIELEIAKAQTAEIQELRCMVARYAKASQELATEVQRLKVENTQLMKLANDAVALVKEQLRARGIVC